MSEGEQCWWLEIFSVFFIFRASCRHLPFHWLTLPVGDELTCQCDNVVCWITLFVLFTAVVGLASCWRGYRFKSSVHNVDVLLQSSVLIIIILLVVALLIFDWSDLDSMHITVLLLLRHFVCRHFSMSMLVSAPCSLK